VLGATLALVAGSVAGSSEPQVVALGQSFTLKIGESAQIEGGAFQIGFEGVSADSRCPKGEQCIRAGEATIQVGLRQAKGVKETHALRVSSENEELSYEGYEVKALRLDPYPISGKAIEQSEYSVSLEVARLASPPSAR